MIKKKAFLLSDTSLLRKMGLFEKAIPMFLVSKVGFIDPKEGGARLYEVCEDFEFFGFSQTGGFSYEVVGEKSVFAANDYLIVLPNNPLTVLSFIAMGEFECEDCLAMSSSTKILVDYRSEILHETDIFKLASTLIRTTTERSFQFIFHTLHIDLNLIIGCVNDRESIARCLGKVCDFGAELQIEENESAALYLDHGSREVLKKYK